jgi:hypothetical protein
LSKGIEHRLLALERTMCSGQATEPPVPKYEWAYYFRLGVVCFAGPGHVRSTALFDLGDDVAVAVAWLNWHLRTDPVTWILLDETEINAALTQLAAGWFCVAGDWAPGDVGWPVWAKCGSHTNIILAAAVGAAICAWMDQGQPVELSAAGIVALLQSWLLR